MTYAITKEKCSFLMRLYLANFKRYRGILTTSKRPISKRTQQRLFTPIATQVAERQFAPLAALI
jgi:hypothetical protein